MAVSATRSAISWYGRSLPMKSARSVAPFFWKRANKLVCSKEGCGFVKEKEKEENGQGIKFVEEQKR